MKRDNSKQLREHILKLLRMEGAHIGFDETTKDFSPHLRGAKPDGTPHTAWQLLEHLRIAQWDILEFSRDAEHVSPRWPGGYWPKGEAPPSAAAWEESIRDFKRDLKQMMKLIANASDKQLLARIPHGEGQTLLREALLVADHNSYHLGQLVFLRKMLEKRGQ